MIRKWTGWIGAMLMGVALVSLCWRLYAGSVPGIAGEAYGVVTGHARWIASQQRVMGPYAVKYISEWAEIPFRQAMLWYMGVGIFAMPLVVYGLLLAMGVGASDALARTGLFGMLIVCATDQKWFMVWDVGEIIIFSVFAWMVSERKGLAWIVPLFLVALLNRESALFMGLYVFLSSFRWMKAPRWGWMSAGLLMLVFGIVWTKLMRTVLFHGSDPAHEVFGNHFYLAENIRTLAVTNWSSLLARNSVFALFVGAAALCMRRAVGLTVLAMLAAVVMVNYPNESRAFYYLVPMMAMIGWREEQ